MKIFFLPTSYPDARHPQKTIFIYEQAKQLARMGHEITVLHINRLPSSQLLTASDKSIRRMDDGFAIRYVVEQKTFAERQIPYLSKNQFVKNAERLFQRAAEERSKPDVIYAHFSQWAGYAGTILSEKYGVPLVTLEHFSQLIDDHPPTVLMDCVKQTMEKSQYFLCVSEKLKESLIKKMNPAKELLVVPNMIDPSFIYQPLKPHEGFVFSSIGRLVAVKDYPTLISAFISAFSPSENVTLRIGGSGEGYRKLSDMVRSAGREHQIVFLGGLTREQTIDEYINCDCFALASIHETFGIVYREALVTGRPIITTDHEGFEYGQWHDEYGYRVPKKNIKALAKAMRQIKDNYFLFDGRLISELCLRDCSADIIGARIEEILIKAKGEFLE